LKVPESKAPVILTLVKFPSPLEEVPIATPSIDPPFKSIPVITPVVTVPKLDMVEKEAPPVEEESRAREKGKVGFVPVDKAGLDTLADEAISNVQDVRKVLFPDGTSKSFRRDIATASRLPILGKAAPFNKDAQNVERKIKTALSARILIMTGVAARPEEIQSQYDLFIANLGSDPDSAFEALDQLESFNTKYKKTLRGRGQDDSTSSQSQSDPEYQKYLQAIGGQ